MRPTGTQASNKRQQMQFPFKEFGGNGKQRQSDRLQIKARGKKRYSVLSFFSRMGACLQSDREVIRKKHMATVRLAMISGPVEARDVCDLGTARGVHPQSRPFFSRDTRMRKEY